MNEREIEGMKKGEMQRMDAEDGCKGWMQRMDAKDKFKR